ncbi:hypothetical protein [Saccharopolyspora spinosa]|uniref:hypothetical protein n=1 Tax=Saccharopolyspora spinosa TaxID=60894 RepID=UPI000237A8B9
MISCGCPATLPTVYPTSVYWHAGSKATLLASVCELALSAIALPDPTSRRTGSVAQLIGTVRADSGAD